MTKYLLALGMVLALGAQSAVAGMYKWVDDDGNVQYSQTPPMDRKAERLKAPKAPPADDSYTPPSLSDGQSDGEKDQGQPKVATENPQDPAKREALIKKNCEAARNNLQVYTQHRRIKQGDKVIVLSDDERQQRIAEAKKQMEKYCK